ncbi:MAG: CoA transferase [Chloroflexota bacterium]|nr:CoA transferase [Chloroflexota bacterium]
MLLTPYRVLDLTNQRGMLTGQILADLGADVIAIEPPGGSTARSVGPFAGDDPGTDRSLFWWAYARNKRGITCNLDHPDGQALVRQLAAGADFVLESEDPGVMAARGLGYDDLSAERDGLIYTSISAFGQSGPKAGYQATDLILMAAGGPLILSGGVGEAPVRVSVPQAWSHACGEAAIAAMVALRARSQIGRGQYIDISAQQSVAAATMSANLAASIGAAETARVAGGMAVGPFTGKLIWEVADGYISLTFLFGSGIGPFSQRLFNWMYDEGECSLEDRDLDWIGLGAEFISGARPLSDWARLMEVVGEFLRKRSRDELFAEAQSRSLLIVPVTTVDEVANSEQFEAREFWREHEMPGWPDPVRFPGPFVKLSDNEIEYRRRAPTIGEHNAEVYAELGLDDAALGDLRKRGVI